MIDLLVGFRAESNAEMSRIDDEYTTSPGGFPADFYEITEELGPLLFQIGLVAPLLLLAFERPRRIPRWSPIVALLAFAPSSPPSIYCRSPPFCSSLRCGPSRPPRPALATNPRTAPVAPGKH